MDRLARRSILGNLLGNAIQHSGSGAEIWVTASVRPEGLGIEVRDNGVGITPRDLKRILLPFEKVGDPTFANVEGLGLGLSIAQELAALQGTTLTITSEPGKGTIATLLIPAARMVRPSPTIEEDPPRRAMAG